MKSISEDIHSISSLFAVHGKRRREQGSMVGPLFGLDNPPLYTSEAKSAHNRRRRRRLGPQPIPSPWKVTGWERIGGYRGLHRVGLGWIGAFGVIVCQACWLALLFFSPSAHLLIRLRPESSQLALAWTLSFQRPLFLYHSHHGHRVFCS